MARLFGTDGVRGIANQDLSPELAFKLGQAGAILLSASRKGKIVVGRDTRISGDLLETALISGICSAGVDVVKVGIMPTPAIAYLTRASEADAGVVISASHNPVEYNGIKFFSQEGFKLSDEMEDKIEALVRQEKEHSRPTGGAVGTVLEAKDGIERYVNHTVSTIPDDLEGLKVAVDCAHGATYFLAPLIYRQLGAEVLVVNAEPNGLNINDNCGSTHPEYIQEIVHSHKVDLGLAHDGDGDRVIVIDQEGNIVDGDFIMAICAVYFHQAGKLPGNVVVTTVMTNLGFDLAMQRNGIEVVKTKVGDRYVLEEMLARNIILGGEQSGHIIFLNHQTTGDGILTALQLMAVMKSSGKRLSELSSVMTRLPQVLLNVRVLKGERLAEAASIWDMVRMAEEKLSGRGRVLVRSSGTEPLVRVMVEDENEEEAKSIAESIAGIIKEELG